MKLVLPRFNVVPKALLWFPAVMLNGAGVTTKATVRFVPA